MSPVLLGFFSEYGVAALFTILLIASIGLPFPCSLLLLAAGSLAAQGQIDALPALLLSITGAVIGDQIGFGLARWGGRPLVEHVGARLGAAERIERAEAFVRRWAWASVFFTRWLIGGLAPWVNLATGTSGYSWGRFLFWDITGKALWVVLYGGLGFVFSDRIEAIGKLLGNLTWALAGLAITLLLAYRLYRRWYADDAANADATDIAARLDVSPSQ